MYQMRVLIFHSAAGVFDEKDWDEKIGETGTQRTAKMDKKKDELDTTIL